LTISIDGVLWLAAAVCFGLCAFLPGLGKGKVGWMCLGFMFAALTNVL
jgi:F0F1-type ATP synthase membrane subunit c/vacuolar-type H+-ATPase subunit K